MTYAGFWKRFLAYIIDMVLVSIVIAPVSRGPAFSFVPVAIFGVWLYYALLESSKWQATLGKKAIGIKVTDLNGNRITFWRATGRHFAKIISKIILMIGFLMAGFTAKKQALHDMIAGTLVIKS